MGSKPSQLVFESLHLECRSFRLACRSQLGKKDVRQVSVSLRIECDCLHLKLGGLHEVAFESVRLEPEMLCLIWEGSYLAPTEDWSEIQVLERHQLNPKCSASVEARMPKRLAGAWDSSSDHPS